MKKQRGGFAVGLIVGLLIGLVLALGVAMYVTKVPVPFINKVPQHSADQDAAEAQRNKNWDPNAPLSGEPPSSRPAASSALSQAASAANPGARQTPLPPPPGLKLPPPPGVTAAPTKPAAAAASAAVTPPRSGLSFFAQAGAFSRVEDAQAQRAKLTLMGLDAKITEREQAGRTVYRVRVGPFDKRAAADDVLAQLRAANVDASLVRVEGQ